jgi:hypothetical protein
MKQPYDTALMLCAIEQHCLNMKKLLADGSMLQGHTAKKLEAIDQPAVRAELGKMKATVASFEQLVNE